MALITAGAVVIGIVAIAANPLLNQPPSAAHLVDPAKPAPAALASSMALGEADAKVTIDVYADTPSRRGSASTAPRSTPPLPMQRRRKQ